MAEKTAEPTKPITITAGFIDRCERTLMGETPLSDDDQLRLFRLAGHTEDPPNCMAYWPSVWGMIDDARRLEGISNG